MEPGTKFEGSFISIHRPSNDMLVWNSDTNFFQYVSVYGFVKSGNATEPGHTWYRNETQTVYIVI